MLVLSRKPGEKLLIGSNVIVEVLEIRGNRVRIGITADGETIVREELLQPEPLTDLRTMSRGISAAVTA